MQRLLIVLLGCATLPACVPSNMALPPSSKAAEQCRRLERAYRSPFWGLALTPFFRALERETVPISDAERAALDDTSRAVYEIVEAFYDPPAHRRALGETDYAREIERTTRYSAFNAGTLTYTVARHVATNSPWSFSPEHPEGRAGSGGLPAGGDTWEYTENIYPPEYQRFNPARLDSIEQFRPRLTAPTAQRILFLKPDDRQALTCFLNRGFVPAGSRGIMSTAVPAQESVNRSRMLRPYLTLVPGHWGGYWHVETQPIVTGVVVNQSLDEAAVMLRLGYRGGYALYRKQAGRWALVREALTWIE